MAITEAKNKHEVAGSSSRSTLDGLYTSLNEASDGLGGDKKAAQLSFLKATTELYKAAAEPEQGRAFQTVREAIAKFQEIIPLLGGNEQDALSIHVHGVYRALREFAQGPLIEANWQKTQQELMTAYNVKKLWVATPVEPRPGSDVFKQGMAELQLPSTMEAFLALSKLDKKEVAAAGSGAGIMQTVLRTFRGGN
jgi:hypothetical protein